MVLAMPLSDRACFWLNNAKGIVPGDSPSVPSSSLFQLDLSTGRAATRSGANLTRTTPSPGLPPNDRADTSPRRDIPRTPCPSTTDLRCRPSHQYTPPPSPPRRWASGIPSRHRTTLKPHQICDMSPEHPIASGRYLGFKICSGSNASGKRVAFGRIIRGITSGMCPEKTSRMTYFHK